jgi:hypothetical protein
MSFPRDLTDLYLLFADRETTSHGEIGRRSL